MKSQYYVVCGWMETRGKTAKKYLLVVGQLRPGWIIWNFISPSFQGSKIAGKKKNDKLNQK